MIDPAARAALARFPFVTEETAGRLAQFVALLRDWNRTHNLVGPKTLGEVWERHVADSLQLVPIAPDGWTRWVDLGSGAGFPGLVAAIAAEKLPGRTVTLVESNAKKAAFLRAAAREADAAADIANQRIEAHSVRFGARADVVSARALAPLPELLRLATPYAHAATLMLFPKGEDFRREVNDASQQFDFDVLESPSATDSGSRVLAIRNVSPKVRRP